MHGAMQTFPQEEAERERSEIPVDNSQFSTLSTDFSTGVFHRGSGVWIFIFGSHKKRRQLSPKSPLFRKLCFSQQPFLCAKNQDLTGSRKAAADGPGRMVRRQKNLKRGLILFDESAIMCVCMENFEEGGALHAQH